MRIRTQLILAAFVLAVVPLVAIVTYSYHSSRRALESAYRREAERLTRQMDGRLASIRTDLAQRMNFVSALAHENAPADVGNIVSVMGEAATFVDALEYKPLAQSRPPAAAGTAPRPAESRAELPETPEVAEAPEPPEPPEPVVIDLPPMPAIPRYVISEEQQELLDEIAQLGVELSDTTLAPEDRQDLRKELEAAQRHLRRVVAADRAEFHKQMLEAHAATRERQRAIEEQRRARQQLAGVQAAPAPQPAPRAAPAPTQTAAAAAPAVNVTVRGATASDVAKSAAATKKTQLILGRDFEAPVRHGGEVIGRFTARISPEHVIQRVLGGATDDGNDIPFALDKEGTLYARNPAHSEKLERLGIAARVRSNQPLKGIDGWIVSTTTDKQSGLRFGVARPVDNLDELRNTAARNFGLGLGLVALALIGIVPLSNHLTRDVKLVTEGAERIAHGDLMTRLPIKTKNEIGQLARAFNRMAEDLSIHQQKLLEQERMRKEQELQQRLLAVEYERKTHELEEARRFQLSMLPKEVPRHESLDVAVFTRTATEVGGDYYDFHIADGTLSITIGDATGHGAKAGTMVTVVKTLFAAYDGHTAPAEFLADAAAKIKRMDLGRMAMALSLARFDQRTLTLASAGMPPVLVHRAAEDRVDEIALSATPLGTYGSEYPQTTVAIDRGDTVLFLSDGFPELQNAAGQQLGYTGALDAFAVAARSANADGVIARLAEAGRAWHGDAPPNDDVTFVVVRVV